MSRSGAASPRFGVMLYPDQPFPELVKRARWIEELGFDQIFLPDHSGNLHDYRCTWHDCWIALAAIAVGTSTIRIGPLVANQILRPPTQLGSLAMSLDHLSGGRIDVGIGAGVFAFDHHSVGGYPWTARERMRRFRDYVRIVDGYLRAERDTFSYRGAEVWVQDAPTAPGPLQPPRPPITVGGQSPTVLHVAAEVADTWNTHGPPGASAEQVLEATERQTRLIDRYADEANRDPATIRRAYTIFGPWDPRHGRHTYEEIFHRFTAIGISDFVLDWPADPDTDTFIAAATETIPALRRDAVELETRVPCESNLSDWDTSYAGLRGDVKKPAASSDDQPPAPA